MKVQSIKNGAVTIATLFAMLFAFPFMAKAQTRYKLQLAGMQVTSANCNDLSVIEGVSGTVKYDPSSKILTLENATITTNTEQNCISVEEAGVTVVVKGTCKLSALSSFGSSAFYVNKSTTITGSGTLFTESTNSCGVYLSNAPLTIDGCHVEAKGKWGIAGEAATIEESLTLKNATIVAEGHEGSIYDLGSLTLEECEISEPKGAVFNESNHAVCDASGNTIKTKVTIKPTSTVAKYNLHLAEVQVTEANCNDLSVIDGVSGTVKYDPNSNTLTLDNATIDVGDDKNCIFAGKGAIALTIVIKGTCKLSSTTWSPLNLWRNTTISGDGELYLESKEGRSINLDEGVTLTIDRCRVDAKGARGISGFNQSSDAKLVIKNAFVTAEGTEGSIANLASLTLEGCKISEPARAVFNESKGAVCDASGNVITTKVVIKPPVKYDLELAGKQVTEANRNDLSVIDGVSGTVKYDPTTTTLTLENATIDGGEQFAIFAGEQGTPLTIVVKGTCKLSSRVNHTVILLSNTTISGDGELYLESKEGRSINLDEGVTLTIDRCRVDAKGVRGISGYNQSSNAKLVIKNAFVTAQGSEGSIANLSSLTLEECKISEPVGAVFNESKLAVCDAAGNVITTKVVIKPNKPDAIERISWEEPAYRGIYNLQGIKLDIPFEQLPIGVYIVDGKKVLKM